MLVPEALRNSGGRLVAGAAAGARRRTAGDGRELGEGVDGREGAAARVFGTGFGRPRFPWYLSSTSGGFGEENKNSGRRPIGFRERPHAVVNAAVRSSVLKLGTISRFDVHMLQVNPAQLPIGGSMGAPAPNPAGTLMQSWLEKWSEWEIQAVISVSFVLQVILFLFSGIRRYSLSSLLKVLLWLVYLLADAAAIYALGHMSASLSRTSSDKHQLVALWAPFLLLHLGGQDNITAYALEDNKLWLRHLLNMFVQAAGTGYVLHKYIIADRATIFSAPVLVSVAGFFKYGERIWALKSASKVSYGPDQRELAPSKYERKDLFTLNKKFATYEFLLMTAHGFLNEFVKAFIILRDEESTKLRKHVLDIITDYVDDTQFGGLLRRETRYPVPVRPGRRASHVDAKLDQGDVRTREKRYAEEVYRLIEMQLALYYDTLFTKAQVIHTWYGLLIHGISFVSCIGALVAFIRSKIDGYSTPDIVITFVLLGGACVLEVASAFKVIGSTWTQALLRGHELDWLARPILFARYHLIVVKDGMWSNSVGQYDFISFCGFSMTDVRGIMAGWIRLEDWWNKAHYTKHVKLSPAFKEIVWGLLSGEKSRMVQIEDLATRSGYWARRLTGFNQSEEFDWSLKMEFHNCVYIWHIATSTFLSHPLVKLELVDNGMAEAVNTLSNYMMYLLVQHPDIVPMNAAARSLSRETYDCFGQQWNLSHMHSRDEIVDKSHQIVSDFFEKNYKYSGPELKSGLWDREKGKVMLGKASILVRTFLEVELELRHKLVIIGRVWTEILSYVATNASADFHAKRLSNGGEFLTHMLLLNAYCSGRTWTGAYDEPVEVVNPVKPTKDVGGHVELKVYNDSEQDITASH